MRFVSLRVLALVLLAASSVCMAPQTVHAQQLEAAPTTTVLPPLPKPLEEQKSRGAQIYYLGRYETLEGWMMVRNGQPEFYYATTDGKAVIMGFLFDADGEVITAHQVGKLAMTNPEQAKNLSQMVSPEKGSAATRKEAEAEKAAEAAASASQPPAPLQTPVQTPTPLQPIVTPTAPADAQATSSDIATNLERNSPSNMLMDELAAAPSVGLGQTSAALVYAFVDPNCPHCKRFLREMEPYIKAGQVQLRLLPVGFNDQSLKQSAFLLAAADGGERLLKIAKTEVNDIPIDNTVNTDAVTSNVQILQRWNMMATPMVIYRNSAQEVKIVKGRPVDMPAMVRDLLGR